MNFTLADVSPDVLVMIGDDQKELFQDDNMPAMLVYWGDTFPLHNAPMDEGNMCPVLTSGCLGLWGEGARLPHCCRPG